MRQSIGARRLNIRGTTKDRARFTALADDRQLTAADLYRRMLFGRAPKRGKMLLIDPRSIAELLRQGANLRSLYNELNWRRKWHAGASAEILKSIGAAVMTASRANDKYMARRTQ